MITTVVNMGQHQVYALIIKVKEKSKTPNKNYYKTIGLGEFGKY